MQIKIASAAVDELHLLKLTLDAMAFAITIISCLQYVYQVRVVESTQAHTIPSPSRMPATFTTLEHAVPHFLWR